MDAGLAFYNYFIGLFGGVAILAFLILLVCLVLLYFAFQGYGLGLALGALMLLLGQAVSFPLFTGLGAVILALFTVKFIFIIAGG